MVSSAAPLLSRQPPFAGSRCLRAYAPTSVYEKGVDGQDAPIRAAGSADEAVALAVAGFPERGLGVFAPEVMNADGDFVMVYHKPLELDDKFLSVNRVGE